LSKIISTKNTKAIFLVTLLILGTLSTISPSFMVGAQAVPQYGMEREYGSYEQPEYGIDNNNYQKSYGEDSYGPEYKDKEYNSYESDYGMDNDRKSYKTNSYEPTTTSYGNDNSYQKTYGNDNSYDNKKSYETNSYEPTTSYGMDDKKSNSYGYSDYGKDNNDRKSYDKKPYRNDNSYDNSQYLSSYKPDSYKPQYPSYGKDDRDKSDKDSSKSVSITKLNCINTNLNINGNNTGDINIGNKGQVPTTAEEGYLGASSSSGSGYGDERYYDNGYSKQDKGFECIINNNNTNINIAGGGNQTELLTCEECFTTNLNETQLENLTDVLSSRPDIVDLEGLCELLSNATITNEIKLLALIVLFNEAGITDENILRKVLACLADLKLITLPPQGLPSMR